MSWDIEVTDEFDAWYAGLNPVDRDAVTTQVDKLEIEGPTMGRPGVDTVKGSKFPNMKELRVDRSVIRIFFAFDPRRTAILLIGASKRGSGRFYERMISIADALYAEHLAEVEDDSSPH